VWQDEDQRLKKPGRPLIRCRFGLRDADIEAYAPEQPLMFAHMLVASR
jgi:hypothetical protein